MRKDIPVREVKNIKLAVVNKIINGEEQWSVCLINLNNFDLEELIVNSKGYGEIDGVRKKTAVLRKRFSNVPANSWIEIEPIDPSLFVLTNEFMISFFSAEGMLDKKFIFPAEYLNDCTLFSLPEIEGSLGIYSPD